MNSLKDLSFFFLFLSLTSLSLLLCLIYFYFLQSDSALKMSNCWLFKRTEKERNSTVNEGKKIIEKYRKKVGECCCG
jgi:hypothetical protein